MPAPPRRRVSHRRETTRQAIIETAESLFGEQGIDAVSLRQIGAATGARNTAVVLYHFGDKQALLEAILLWRLPALDERRAELLAALKGEPNIAGLLNALLLPLFELRDICGKRSYAAFLGSLGRSQLGWVWSRTESIVPVTVALSARLKALLSPTTQQFFVERAVACTALVTAAIGLIDTRIDLDAKAELVLFEDAIRMAAAAFGAPGKPN
jgi:AcrR family transcriptional regulator